MWDKVRLLYHTLKFLKPIQIYYRLFYWLRERYRRISGYVRPLSQPGAVVRLPNMLADVSPAGSLYLGDNTFRFLNREKRFAESIDWNYAEYGKLWTYNLTYFEYLLQPEISPDEGLRLIRAFIAAGSDVRDGWEPYPLSLRIIHWIKFLVRQGINDPEINASLRAQVGALIDQREYHLLGNHLLENGFALFFAAVYFRDRQWYGVALDILRPQLAEQILRDGAHFELSPMYHQLMLWRVLDCYNLARQNQGWWTEFSDTLAGTGRRMVSWLRHLTFADGSIPLLNDAAPGINPSSASILEYAARLDLVGHQLPLSDSGYRIFCTDRTTTMVDVGRPGPDYIPGHAHCDALSIVLAVDGRPVLVDRGVSTYEATDRRLEERSTSAHNTVQVGEYEQAEIWASFRMGRRSVPSVTTDEPHRLTARIDYPTAPVWHERDVAVTTDGSLHIVDRCNARATAYFHFHPDVKVAREGKNLRAGNLTFAFSAKDWSLEDYRYAAGFNNLVPAIRAVVPFDQSLTTHLSLSRSFS